MNIHDAILEGNVEIVKCIISNIEEIFGDDPTEYALNYACEFGKLEIVKYLCSNNEIESFNEYAIQLAAMEGHSEIVKYLCEAGMDFRFENNAPFRWSARNGHYNVVKYLCEASADLHSFSDNAVHWASKNGHFEVTKYLIEKGADVSKIFFLEKYQKYISFCEKIQTKIKERAQKKIYFWWIPICYSLTHHSGCGKRMMMKNLEKAKDLGLELYD